ncbi:putative quinol monooxygenase [Marinobacterium arenosum]|uniref:putative quinol monooxygenase n=1 Tax=Marinobacterium arenosum TaxID=2862496 RepID=UPI001C979805|nr:putative quinol monooxygenase [Marinobacterium arenosum]MBY4676454.1 antibiotic biosynthesis monooxygenase [Marinobacterium arenosum]
MNSYDLIARIRVTDPQRLEEARKELALLERETRHEPGCLQFSVFEDNDREGDFLLWESWRGKESLDAHFEAEHTKRCLALGLTEVVEITPLTPVERLGDAA